MDALTLLKQDHDQVKKDLADLLEVPLDGRAALFHKVEIEVRAHEAIEEEILYPALKKHPEAREEVLEAFEEHHVVDEIMGELMNLPVDAESWHAKAQVMGEELQHHIREEESEMVPEARKAFDGSALAEMGRRMAERKESALAELRNGS